MSITHSAPTPRIACPRNGHAHEKSQAVRDARCHIEVKRWKHGGIWRPGLSHAHKKVCSKPELLAAVVGCIPTPMDESEPECTGIPIRIPIPSGSTARSTTRPANRAASGRIARVFPPKRKQERIRTCMALVGAEVCTAHEGPLSCRENMSGASSVHPSGVHSASPVAFREGAGAAIIDGASGRSAGSRPRCARGSILAWEVQRQQAQRRNTKHSCMSSSKRLKLRKKQEQQNARAHAAGSPMSHEPSNVAQQWCERACQDLVCMHPDG